MGIRRGFFGGDPCSLPHQGYVPTYSLGRTLFLTNKFNGNLSEQSAESRVGLGIPKEHTLSHAVWPGREENRATGLLLFATWRSHNKPSLIIAIRVLNDNSLHSSG